MTRESCAYLREALGSLAGALEAMPGSVYAGEARDGACTLMPAAGGLQHLAYKVAGGLEYGCQAGGESVDGAVEALRNAARLLGAAVAELDKAQAGLLRMGVSAADPWEWDADTLCDVDDGFWA
jgi:hypothetical protein